jgi:tetratricopeptide (TPR) repeat protein
MPEPPEEPADQGMKPAHGTHSQLSGSAADVVQARDVTGGVHFHQDHRHDPARIPRQLPGDVRGFVNRTAELDRLDAVLPQAGDQSHAVAVLVIDGTAGVGKTSLAVHWAHQVRDRFPDGQLYVNLRGYDPGTPVNPTDALEQFLRALDIRSDEIPTDDEAKAALYRSLVADRRLLIVLDNAATVGQVRPLLPGSGSCLVLVTSRSRLPGLAVRNGALRVSVGTLRESDAIVLMRAVTAGYRDGDEASELRELTRLCARLPLALRIAAERAASRPRMPLTELLQDLRDESALWDALSTADDEEASAVRTVFAWSYRALPQGTARLFRLLGLHPGPEFSIQAAAAMAASPVRDIRPVLDALTGAHLVEETGRDRYQFHDLLRLYALDQAHQDESEDDQLRALERVVAWYLHGARAAVARIATTRRVDPIDLYPLPDGVSPLSLRTHGDAVHWYDSERVNLIAATHAAVQAGLDRLAWQIPAVLGPVYSSRDAVGTWLGAQQAGLAAAQRDGDRYGEALLLETIGIQDRLSFRLPSAAERYIAALAAYRDVGEPLGQVYSLLGLGLLYRRQRHLEQARDQFEQATSIADTIADQALSAVLVRNLGCVYLDLGQVPEAERRFRQASRMFHSTEQHTEHSMTLRFLGAAQIELEQFADARASLSRALAIARDQDSPAGESVALLELSRLELAAGSAEESLVSSQRVATLFRQFGHRGHEALALRITGDAYQLLGRPEEAVAFHRRTVAIQRDLGDSWQLAVALHHLATTLDETGKRDEAGTAWREAADLVADLPGPRADQLRANITRGLNS